MLLRRFFGLPSLRIGLFGSGAEFWNAQTDWLFRFLLQHLFLPPRSLSWCVVF
jgi:hypothetical protein